MFLYPNMKSVTQHLPLYLIATLFVANVFIYQGVFANESRSGILTVSFLDVGQGDAIFIEAPNGNQMLIDGGEGSAVLRELGKALPSLDRAIDIVLATHPDKDHIGGLPEVFARYDVSYFLEPGVPNDTAAYRALLSEVEKEEAEHILARRGMVLWLDEEVALTILFPDRDLASAKDTNIASVVARLVYGETEFLFTGDAPKSIEEYLVSIYGDAIQSDVLKVGHHGSRTSTSPMFLKAVTPAVSVISAGEQNRYGHPHKEVVDVIANAGSSIAETYKNGAVVFKSNGVDIWEE
jgi:competence protein ComEC